MIFIFNKTRRAELVRNNRPEFAEQKEEEKDAYLVMFTCRIGYLNNNSESYFSILKIAFEYIYKDSIFHLRLFCRVVLN